MSTNDAVRVIQRKDYSVPNFWIDNVELEFDLAPNDTLVIARLTYSRNADQPAGPLELDGEQLELQGVWLDGQLLSTDRYSVTDEKLTIQDLPDKGVLQTKVKIRPADNTSLYGLYQSSGNFCTQCEALGFRRITFFPDRPDVMARFQVTIRADRAQCPVMLSNGNRISQSDLDDGRHEVVWHDPFPKPSYLFALVAGDLKCHSGKFVTRSGREVALEIWVEPQNIEQCEHALVSLQKSMKWDEETFGLEYDLDIYMIVAVNDFNMGAMENKGLNIFNSKYVLALPETATDDDYLGVEAVIAHEYFHNWTGNRVTCRDWFQLTLKEGLTVFRDQQFTADQTSAAVKRIDDVRSLRARQFLEDSGPMAHPIRPESYIAMDNFYTATVYDKGAEIIRMYHTRLSKEGFRQGMDLYFERHDGGAVTCDDFRAAMADANDANLDSLDRWYSQPGTPELEVSREWNSELGQLTLTCRQSFPPLPDDIPGASNRRSVPIPIAIGLLDSRGNELAVQLSTDESDQTKTTRVVLFDDDEATFVFTNLNVEPIPSVLRGFSAPVRLRMDRSADELAFLMAHETDAFNRWDASQTLAAQILIGLTEDVSNGKPLEMPATFDEAFGKVLADETLDGSIKSLLLTLPGEGVLGQEMEVIDPDAVHEARQFVRHRLAQSHRDLMLSIYHQLAKDAIYSNDPKSINDRRLKSTILAYLALLEQPETTALVADQFHSADNMTDVQSALALLTNLNCPQREVALESFYNKWREDALVLDKWFSVQAISSQVDTLARVIELTNHKDFTISNPNRVRSLLGAFFQNQVRFHAKDGSGYSFLAEFVLKLDSMNPQLASRLVSSFNSYRRFDDGRQELMRNELNRIAKHEGLSKDVFEIVERALKF